MLLEYFELIQFVNFNILVKYDLIILFFNLY